MNESDNQGCKFFLKTARKVTFPMSFPFCRFFPALLIMKGTQCIVHMFKIIASSITQTVKRMKYNQIHLWKSRNVFIDP